MIPFLKYKWLYGVISGAVILAGLFSLVRYGFSYSIDFVGGSVLEYSFPNKIDLEKIRSLFSEEQMTVFSLLKEGEKKYLIKTAMLDDKKASALRQKLESRLKTKITVLRFETVGSTLGVETRMKTIIAALVAIVGIFVYLTIVFSDFRYAISAIGAMMHDFLVVLGSYSLLSHFFGAELDTLFVTAVLTVMSFSVHDTIVVFDKIREYRKSDSSTSLSILANKAVTETIVRSLNNSLTIILMLVALLLLGGSTIRFFVATLLIGTITGTYSSPFIAVPLLEILERRKKR